MVRIGFYLLDISHEVINGEPEIRLWGMDDENNRVLIDRNFLPYFYLLLDEEADLNAVVKEVEEKRALMPDVVGVEAADKKYLGKTVRAIKVTCKNPDLTTEYAVSLSKIGGVKDHLEDDIRYSLRYLVDNDVDPCGWHAVEVEELENKIGAKVDKVCLAEATPRAIEKTGIPSLKVLSFSTVCYSRMDAPRPDRSPVIIISVATSEGVFLREMDELAG